MSVNTYLQGKRQILRLRVILVGDKYGDNHFIRK